MKNKKQNKSFLKRIFNDYKVVISSEDTFLPAEERNVGMVFQDYALFPHLNVEKNIAFGLSRDEIKSGRLEEVLSMCNLEIYRNKFPHELSGWQQQRVSLARALAPKPEVILLDEPFTSLDAHMARDLREEVVSLLRQTETTALIVTHDQEIIPYVDKVVKLHQVNNQS